VSLDAGTRVAQLDVLNREFAEVRPTLAHHHGHEVDSETVEQTELQALPAIVPAVTATVRLPAISFAVATAGLDPVGDEVERSVGVGVDPGCGYLVGHDDDRDVHGVPAAPSVGDVEQRSAAYQRTQPGNPLPPVVGALRAQVEGDVFRRGAALDVPVL
jgi:hypothetical protein